MKKIMVTLFLLIHAFCIQTSDTEGSPYPRRVLEVKKTDADYTKKRSEGFPEKTKKSNALSKPKEKKPDLQAVPKGKKTGNQNQ